MRGRTTRPSVARPLRPSAMGSLPARFRRPRLLLVGFGDVAARILAQRASLSAGLSRGPRFLCVGRSLGWDLDRRDHRRRLAHLSQQAIVLVPPADRHPSQDLRSRRLSMALRAAAVGARARGVYLSTTGVYGDHAGDVVTETSACLTHQPRSLRRLDAEAQWRGLGFHVLRVPGILAHDRLPTARLQAGSPALRAEEDVYTNHIHADDLARIAYVALWRGRPGRVTNTVDESELKMGDYFDLVADRHGLPRPPRISREALSEAVASGQMSPMMASFMQDSRRVRSLRLQPELGVLLHYPRVEDCLPPAPRS